MVDSIGGSSRRQAGAGALPVGRVISCREGGRAEILFPALATSRTGLKQVAGACGIMAFAAISRRGHDMSSRRHYASTRVPATGGAPLQAPGLLKSRFDDHAEAAIGLCQRALKSRRRWARSLARAVTRDQSEMSENSSLFDVPPGQARVNASIRECLGSRGAAQADECDAACPG